ncbi:amino acid transporter [Lysobacter enzymogenes]|uniref:APC family permease n=1 Tax=Lysobacter enzymogenes TaxID=69 RepID=UPI0019D19C27|nr:APC family permease [Lysobacter enzymogenes]MBN7138557.1 amino acid transporter [Lysobacter enzymogenes]
MSQSTSRAMSAAPAALHLKRSLTLRDLILFGVIAIQPVAPMASFGVLYESGRGHVVTMVLIAMLAMLLTGISYGRMAQVYPSAGSAFAYVSRAIHPAFGWATGWSMLMDYVLNPVICTIWCAQQAFQLAPAVPLWLWKVGFAAFFTLLNIRGVRSSARTNAWLAAGMGVVVVLVFVAAIGHLTGERLDASALIRPFYDPSTFAISTLMHGTSIAVLTYIGFDGISTLSEEVENPRRNILLATVLTCLAIGVLAAAEVYLAQLVWPAGQAFASVETAYVEAVSRAWAPLALILGVTLLVANFGSGMAAQMGAARLLYSMGRSGALPGRAFATLDPDTRVPRNNVIFVGSIVMVGAFLMSFSLGAEMLNFGALLGFMGVNMAAFLHYFVRAKRRTFWNAALPLAGFVVCFVLWISLSLPAKLIGAAWIALGVAIGAWRTNGFRRKFDFDGDGSAEPEAV